jgi:cell wall-associated NlpC family hydrolase
MQLMCTVRRALSASVLGLSMTAATLLVLGPSATAATPIAPAPAVTAQQIDEAATLALYALVNQPATPPEPKPSPDPKQAPDHPTTADATASGEADTERSVNPSAATADEAAVSPANPVPAEPVVTYADRLLTLATLVAPRVKVDAKELAAVWARTDQRRMIAVITAIGQVGDRYKARGSGPDAFDCSGLFWFSWHQAGVNVPRNSTAIIQAAKPIRRDQVQPGDVIWRPGHVLMALGLGEASVDAPETGRTVQVAPWGKVRRFGSPI